MFVCLSCVRRSVLRRKRKRENERKKENQKHKPYFDPLVNQNKKRVEWDRGGVIWYFCAKVKTRQKKKQKVPSAPLCSLRTILLSCTMQCVKAVRFVPIRKKRRPWSVVSEKLIVSLLVGLGRSFDRLVGWFGCV